GEPRRRDQGYVLNVRVADLERQARGHAIVAIVQNRNDLVRSRHHPANFKRSLVVNTAAKISRISNSAAEGTSAGHASNRKKHYVRVLRRLARNSVDDLPLHAQRTYSRNGEIDAAKHDAGLKVDRSGRLCVGGSWIVNRNIPFGRLVLTIGWRRRRRRYRLGAAPPRCP